MFVNEETIEPAAQAYKLSLLLQKKKIDMAKRPRGNVPCVAWRAPQKKSSSSVCELVS